jgi:hypothetical protein
VACNEYSSNMVVRQLLRLACCACSINVNQLVKCISLGGIGNANGRFQFVLLGRNYVNDENYKSPKTLIILLGIYNLLFRIKFRRQINFRFEYIGQKIHTVNNTKRAIVCVQNPVPKNLEFTEPWNLSQHEYLTPSSTGF